jgi:hypothetical protein
MSTGCSSNVARFNSPADLFTTASTNNQREINDNQNQPYPAAWRRACGIRAGLIGSNGSVRTGRQAQVC